MISRVESVGFTVSNLDAAIAFYTQVLPFRVVEDKTTYYESPPPPTRGTLDTNYVQFQRAMLALGTEQITLTEYAPPLNSNGQHIPPDSRSNDLWFQHIAIVVSDMDAAYARLREQGVEHVSTAPQTLPATIPAAAGVRAFYFRDPDGHNLELIWYPEGKGNPRWQSKEALFLGIDHTAIAVSDSARSLAFYQDVLGLRVAGTSDNFGIEQEQLNGVAGARVHITGLVTPEAGIGVEFLEYLPPHGGRPAPTDSDPNDLWQWEIVFELDKPIWDYSELRRLLLSIGMRMPQHPATPDLTILELNAILRDPDGHFIRIVSKTQNDEA
jgi:catechol 2,3-dioxygenase-like lactoylglutathione lyase family enzyme